MRAPPLYLASAVMFWAWHAQALLVGAAVVFALEAPRVVHARWRLGPAEFARIADLCTWAFVILAGYLIFARGMPIPILEIFRWLPLVMLPLMAAQLYSESGRLPLSALFLMLRGGKHRTPSDRSIDLTYPYAIVCVLSAGAANVRHDAYYYGLVLLAAWALWPARSRRYPWFVWVPMLICVAALGYAGHHGLSRLQDILLESASFGGARTDPYKSTTDIGQIGELKQSDRIVLRVAMPHAAKVPLLLHTASYNAYVSPTWIARDAPFAAVRAEPDGRSWILGDAGGAASPIGVSQPVQRGKAVLALPNGTARVEHLSVAAMRRNPLGAVEIESREDPVIYQAAPDPDAVSRDGPREIDLRVPREEASHLDQLVERLHLKGKLPREVLAIVRNYFEREFSYSTYLASPRPHSTPLADFLLVTRAGHCEYFATATTLILRAAGVPARYATGYSVQEWSPLEDAYIARERHAHAWVRVRVDDRWVDFDTTPPIWFTAEAQDAPHTQGLTDLWSWAGYRFSRWQREHPAASTAGALALVVVLSAILIWRLLLRKPLAAGRARKLSAAAKRSQPGADSEFYQIEAVLVRAGCARAAHEPLGAWLARIGRERADIAVAPLQDLLRLHYRYRFDPHGLDASERRDLSAQAERWLEVQRKHLPERPSRL